jgi:tetratricopeptide (TPR) repeat protein
LIEAWLTYSEGDGAAAQGILGSMPDSGGFQAFRALHQGLMYELAGEADAAEAAYKVAAGAQPGAFRVAQALGGLYERMGHNDQARAVYDAFVEASPETPWLDDTIATLGARAAPPPLIEDATDGAAEVLFGLANALQGEDESEGALAYARMADYLRPDSDVTALLLGEVFELQGRHDDAIEAYRRVAPESPLAWTARLRIAVNLDELERGAEAVADLEAMAAERPTRPDPWVSIGDLRRGAEQWSEAATAYAKAIELTGTLEARHWRLFYVRGIALERAGQWPGAEADFLKALELEPDQPYVLNYLGYSWVDKGLNLGKALDMIESAVDQRPNDGFIVDSLGWAHYRLGDYREAVRHLERAVELQPDDPTINDHLGDALWHVGRHAEAEFQWHRALSLEPDETLEAAIKAKIERGLVAAPSSNGDG